MSFLRSLPFLLQRLPKRSFLYIEPQCRLFFFQSQLFLESNLNSDRRSKIVISDPSHNTPNSIKEYNPRRMWSSDDTEKLLKLVARYGNKWKVFTSYFPGRTPFCIRSHYFSVKCDATRWTLEEKKVLQQHLSNESDPEKIDWEYIQKCLLPKQRTIGRIKQFWQNSIQPSINHGSWTKEETKQLEALVTMHGVKNWDIIAKSISTRSDEQCRNKWAYEVSTTKKGEFTKEEDHVLKMAVKKYGPEGFQKIKEEMNSKRSISQLRTRYTNFLDPEIDRSPWGEEEKRRVIELFNELNKIQAVKAAMGSKRSIRDMYNQLRKLRAR